MRSNIIQQYEHYTCIDHPEYKYRLARLFTWTNRDLLANIEVNSPYIRIRKGMLTLKVGYCWDGATAYHDSPSLMRGSLIHDALYQLLRERLLPPSSRKLADIIYRKVIIADGTSKLLSWAMYATLRLMGRKYATPAT